MVQAGTAAEGVAAFEPVEASGKWVGPPDGAAAEVEALRAFAMSIGQPPLIAWLLRERGLAETAKQAERFLQPTLGQLPDPAAVPGVPEAARRIVAALRASRPIVVYGDYDVDGITASAILYHTLTRIAEHLGLAGGVATYVPHRVDEGYGLHAEALEAIASYTTHPHIRPEGEAPPPPLVVTVDCGITATEAADRAAGLGLDLIVTDHHQMDPDHLPGALLVHPELPRDDDGGGPAFGQDDNTPAPCGAGVAFFLAWEVLRETLHPGRSGETVKLGKTFQRLLVDLLPLAALGTVADVVPLRGVNRVLTAAGLKRIKSTPFEGLHALLRESSLLKESVDAYHVGFVLGPRLNACGRMGHAREAVELFTTATGERAAELAAWLTEENDRRRETEREVLAEAVEQVEAGDTVAACRRAIVVAGEDWHPGVVGIVASRLVDRFHRPAVVLSLDPSSGEAKGSARSIEGVDLHAALRACGGLLDRFGGHAMAAGLTLPTDSVDGLRHALCNELEPLICEADLVSVFKYDGWMRPQDLNAAAFNVVERLAPFGASNRTPRFRMDGLKVARTPGRVGGGGRHLTLDLVAGDKPIRAIAFGRGEDALRLAVGDRVDCVFEADLNTWNGVTRPELRIRDLRHAGG